MMKILTIFFSILATFTLVNCVHDDDYASPTLNFSELPVNYSLEQLKTQALEDPVLINQDSIIEGYVVSSDEGGNIYKTLHLVSSDGKNGIQININKSNTYNFFPPNRKVFVKLKGLYLAKQHNMTQLGGQAQGSYTIGQLVWNTAIEHIFLSEDSKQNAELIQKYEGIEEALNNAHLNTLIEIDHVQFLNSYIGKTYFDNGNSAGGGTDNRIEDIQGNILNVRVSQYAKFAKNIIPAKSGKIRGILTKYKEDFQLLIRTVGDVDMTENLFESKFGEGTQESPYEINQVAKHLKEKEKWVKGYIVGAVNGMALEDAQFEGPFTVASNLLIASSPNEKDPANCIAVQLIFDATGVNTSRQDLNLKDHPENLGREVLLLGDLDTYFKKEGIKNTKSYNFK